MLSIIFYAAIIGFYILLILAIIRTARQASILFYSLSKSLVNHYTTILLLLSLLLADISQYIPRYYSFDFTTISFCIDEQGDGAREHKAKQGSRNASSSEIRGGATPKANSQE